MKTIKYKKLVLLLSALFFASSEMSFANSVLDSKGSSGASSIAGKKKCGMSEKYASEEKNPATDAITIKPSENSYQPYLQFGGTRFFHLPQANTAGTVDLFVPIWQQDLTDLVFTDVRITDRSGTPFEGNIHLGYRHLFSESQQLLGFYGALDRKKTALNNYFNQITVGGEYWIQNWFIGANYYQPIGAKTKELSQTYDQHVGDLVNGIYRDVWVTKNLRNEKAMAGTDAEVGYEFIEGLVGYVGGYYFSASNVSTVAGPRALLTYDLSLKNGRILGIFDKVGLEAGVQHDKPRGTVWYLSANVRLGWLPDKKSALEGVSRHMVDPVRRDIDVVAGEATHKEDSKKYKIVSIDASMERDELFSAVQKAIDNNVDVIDLGGTVTLDTVGKIMGAHGKKNGQKMPAIIVNGELVCGSKDIGEKLGTDLIMSEAISKSHVHFSRGSIAPDARVLLEQSTKQQEPGMQSKTSDDYKRIYTWLNDPSYSGVSNDAVIAIGNVFEQLKLDYTLNKPVNFKAALTVIMKLSNPNPNTPKLTNPQFGKLKKDFLEVMKTINSIKAADIDVTKKQIVGALGKELVDDMNKLKLFGGSCTTEMLVKLVSNSNTKIK